VFKLLQFGLVISDFFFGFLNFAAQWASLFALSSRFFAR
jgi:hypothetical protein